MRKVEAQQARTAWDKVHVRVIAEGKVVEAAEELRHASELGSGRHCEGVRRAMQSLADESCPCGVRMFVHCQHVTQIERNENQLRFFLSRKIVNEEKMGHGRNVRWMSQIGMYKIQNM